MFACCPTCGQATLSWQRPENDTHERQVCTTCGHIHYQNPKMIVGAVCQWHTQFLLCKRAIAPRIGYWTYPSGYLEQRESVEAGVKREAIEEAQINIKLRGLLGLYSLPLVNQVHLVYHADLVNDQYACGIETQAIALFEPADIPWGDLAFPVNRWALQAAIRANTHKHIIPEHRTYEASVATDEFGDVALHDLELTVMAGAASW